jgi:ABC-type transport system involved in cytochrome bd biosynthesis fused ATPase/permease subunit
VWELDAVTAPGLSAPTSWRVLPGERWILRGPSGAGKSSLIDVALGLRAPDTGTVTIPSQRVGVVRASAHFLTGTVRDNLALGENFEDEEMTALLNHLSGQPVGPAFLDQNLHDVGSQLSDGERVRVALARALLHHAEVLVLDDVAALLDESSRRALSTYLSQRRDLTIVEAGHLLIVEQPTHELSLAAVS